jgi:RHS repeat-associated protein
MTDATGTTTWGYDNANRTTSVAQPAGTLTYGYDNAGRRTSMTLPGSRQISYSYNTAGRLDTVTDWGGRWASFAYDAAGRRTSISRSNGVGSTIAYDAAGQTTSIVHAAGGNTLESFAYTYDAAGNRTGLTSPQGNETYSYDSVNRLTNVSYQGGPSVGYSYDAAGNRASETRSGQTTNYTYDNAGQLTQVGSETYTFDGAGNLIQAGSDTYGWDHANRLTSASRDGHSATYAYDGTDVKTSSTVDSDTDDLLVDRLGGLPTVVDDGERAYVQAGGLAWQTSGSGTEFALADGLGSVRGLTNASGSLVGSASFEAFGASRASTGTTSAFGFTGEPTDASGLVDLRARVLDPGIGRFLSIDTVRPNAPGGQGFNLYSYVANNPATWGDPTGHLVDPRQFANLGPEIISFVALRVGPVCAVAPTASKATCAGTAFAAVVTRLLFGLAVLAFLYVDYVVAKSLLGDPGTESSQPVNEGDEEKADRRFPPDPVPPGAGADDCDQDGAAQLVACRLVLLDTNAVISYARARTVIRPDERPVVTISVVAELADVAARKGFSGTLPLDVGIIPDDQSAVLRSQVMQALRAFGSDPVGIQGDAAVGATALANHLPLITDDGPLINAVAKLGGEVRRFR